MLVHADCAMWEKFKGYGQLGEGCDSRKLDPSILPFKSDCEVTYPFDKGGVGLSSDVEKS